MAKKKTYTAKQLAAHEMSRRAFARSKEILAAKGCSVQDSLRAAWAEIKGTKAAANPYHVTPKGTAFYLPPGEIGSPETRGAQKARRILRSEGIDQPLAGFTIRQVGNQYKIIDPDGRDTGKYGLSPESAERLLVKHTRGLR